MGISLIRKQVQRSHRGQRTAKVRKVRMKKAKKANLAAEAEALGITVTALVRLRQRALENTRDEAEIYAIRANAAAAKAYAARLALYSRGGSV